MKFTLTIELGNEAMQTALDVAEALRGTADRLFMYRQGLPDKFGANEKGHIKDENGNWVGSWEIK
jgi:hypothetical protein